MALIVAVTFGGKFEIYKIKLIMVRKATLRNLSRTFCNKKKMLVIAITKRLRQVS